MPLNVLGTDNFNRADENPLASPWTGYLTAGPLRLQSNKVTGTDPSNLNTGSVYGGTGVGSDQWGECVLPDASSQAVRDAGIFVRAQSGGFFAWLFYDGTVVYNSSPVFGGRTTVATRLPTFANGDVLRLEVVGGSPSVLRCYQNGVQVGADISTSGGPQSGGQPGLFVWGDLTSDGTSLDTFRMGDFAVATLDQEGFRFGDDDGGEAAYTFLAAQDTNITRPVNQNTIVRALLNASGDPATKQFKLRASLNGGPKWDV